MELRKDYILDRWIIISENRKKRPHEFKKDAKQSTGICYFCPGNESLTPPEIMRIEKMENGERKWKMRVFPNKFSAANKDGTPIIRTDNKYYTFGTAYGNHEVIVETNDHEKTLANLPKEDIAQVLKIYNQRIEDLEKDTNIRYVSVFKNHKEEGGASIVHSHSQIISTNTLPSVVEEEIAAVKKYNHCPYCEIVGNEKNSFRRCFENDSFAAFTPYASRFHYEIWIFPKMHLKRLNEFDEKKYNDLSEILKNILEKLDSIDAAYNLLVHYAPRGEDLHFHIEICPRLATWAGFEYETGIIINSVSPEDAAKFYRGEDD